MPNFTITIAAADVADALTALEQRWKPDAIVLFFAGDKDAYEAATPAQRGKACLASSVRVAVRNLRRTQAEQGIVVADGDVT